MTYLAFALAGIGVWMISLHMAFARLERRVSALEEHLRERLKFEPGWYDARGKRIR